MDRSSEDLFDRTVPVGSVKAIAPRPRASLLFYHPGGVEAVSLTPGRSIVVGRAPPADLALPDPSLSRQHARLSWKDDALHLEDLGSTNGTTVNGELVEQASIKPGDEICLGQVVVTIHELAAPIHGVEGHERFIARVNEEVERARYFDRPLALLVVRPGDPTALPLTLWCPKVQQKIRPIDRIGLLGPDILAVLTPEAGQDEAARLAERITRPREENEPALRCGIATFPDTARSAAKLVELARRALDQTDDAHPTCSAGSAEDPGRWLRDPSDGGNGAPVIRSAAMREIDETVDRLAKHDIPVLIVGETGTGKELVARAIHERGDRRDGPMRCINCAAIPDQLIESALFGHEKGAFTGAAQRAKGVFEEADGGTVLLDEVGELSPPAQAALLRVLETKQISRVGSAKEIDVDVRVLAATHRDLEAMADAQTFRLDLLYRLNTMVLEIPPLRDRPEEIEPLARHFLQAVVTRVGSGPCDFSPDALDVLLAHRWPGNVRELRNEVERAVVVAQGEVIEAEDLSDRVRLQRGRVGPALPEPPAGDENIPFRELIQQYETRLIKDALEKTKWNQAAASRELGIPLRTLTDKIRAYGLRGK